MAFEKRLEELDDEQIIARPDRHHVRAPRRARRRRRARGRRHVGPAQVDADGAAARRDRHVLDDPGRAVRAGAGRAPTKQAGPERRAAPRRRPKPQPAEARAAQPKPEPKGPPIAAKEVDGKVVLVFPPERFDLDVAAALGKRDWDQVVRALGQPLRRDARQDPARGRGVDRAARVPVRGVRRGQAADQAAVREGSATVDGVPRARGPLPALRRRRCCSRSPARALRDVARPTRRARGDAGEVMRCARSSLLALRVLGARAHADEEPATARSIFARGGVAVSRRCARAAARPRSRQLAGQGDRARAAHRRRRQDPARRPRRHVGVDAARRLGQALDRPAVRATARRSSPRTAPCVPCRKARAIGHRSIVNLDDGKTHAGRHAAPGARLVGSGADRMLVWADDSGVWTAPPANLKTRPSVAPEAPLRGFSRQPRRHARARRLRRRGLRRRAPQEARRRARWRSRSTAGRAPQVDQGGVPLEWSHDSQWVLVQDGGERVHHARESAASTSAGAASPPRRSRPTAGGRSLLGNREARRRRPRRSPRQAASARLTAQAASTPAEAARPRRASRRPPDRRDDREPDEPRRDTPTTTSRSRRRPARSSLYRARLEGAFTIAPTLIVKIVDGAAVWVPQPPDPSAGARRKVWLQSVR